MENNQKEQTYYHGSESIKRQVAFALGGAPMNLCWVIVSSYLMYFLTDVAMVPMVAVSTLFLAVRAFDAINDPLIGLLADNTKSRWGRYRPWMMTGAILLVPTVTLLFWAHPTWSTPARTTYACVLYVLAVVFATMWDIPYGALNSCVTPYANERSKFASNRILVSSFASALASSLVLPLVAKFGGAGGDMAGGYVKAVFAICIFAIPFAIICCKGTKEVVYPPASQKIKFSKLIRVIAKNPPLLIILVSFFAYGFLNYGRSTVATYYFTYTWNNPGLASIYFGLAGILSGLAAFFGFYLLKIFKEKNYTCIFGYAVMVVSNLIVFFASPKTMSSTVMMVLLCVSNAANGLVTGLIYGMVPDTVEYGQWKSGIRTDGFVYASTSFMNKLGGAVGPFLLGILVNAAGYVPNVEQSASSLRMINICMNLMPVILAAVAIVLLLCYKLDRKQHGIILEELAAQNQENA